ncbi:MAG: hypothetical protein CW716_12245 [Candidatus Bathyarchaeum sp.]|nr:MAG: hypothetical protein CW716_12245 [Candidatus Bathyarchaeum sp.]
MNPIFEIDEKDVEILQLLIRDSRSKLKDIAKKCGLSSTAVKNRIDKMKESGLIVRRVLKFNMAFFGYDIGLLIGVNLEPNHEDSITKFIKSKVKVAGIDKTIGKYDLCLVVFAKSINELDELKYQLRKQKGVKDIELLIWSKNYQNFDNIDLLKTKELE